MVYIREIILFIGALIAMYILRPPVQAYHYNTYYHVSLLIVLVRPGTQWYGCFPCK